MSDDKIKWNERYSSVVNKSNANNAAIEIANPSQVLSENSHLLPSSGVALDLACGLGANAVSLAKYGLEIHAWDVSDVAISKLDISSKELGLNIQTEVRDVVAVPPEPESFDVIVVSRFLDRTITDAMVKALKPGGLIFYQTFIADKKVDCGPSNPDYLLNPNELLKMFQDLTIRVYREEGLVGDASKGFRNEAMLVAQKDSN